MRGMMLDSKDVTYEIYYGLSIATMNFDPW